MLGTWYGFREPSPTIWAHKTGFPFFDPPGHNCKVNFWLQDCCKAPQNHCKVPFCHSRCLQMIAFWLRFPMEGTSKSLQSNFLACKVPLNDESKVPFWHARYLKMIAKYVFSCIYSKTLQRTFSTVGGEARYLEIIAKYLEKVLHTHLEVPCMPKRYFAMFLRYLALEVAVEKDSFGGTLNAKKGLCNHFEVPCIRNCSWKALCIHLEVPCMPKRYFALILRYLALETMVFVFSAAFSISWMGRPRFLSKHRQILFLTCSARDHHSVCLVAPST